MTLKATPEVFRFLDDGIRTAQELGLKDVAANLATIREDIKKPLDGKGPCYFPYYALAVSWDGRVSPCCLYYDYQIDLGRLEDKNVDEVWNGPAFQKFRLDLYSRRSQISICQTCPLCDISIHELLVKIYGVWGMKFLTRNKYERIER
jgi:radical SAM protein with 4Fe4S-binding SPASM domain